MISISKLADSTITHYVFPSTDREDLVEKVIGGCNYIIVRLYRQHLDRKNTFDQALDGIPLFATEGYLYPCEKDVEYNGVTLTSLISESSDLHGILTEAFANSDSNCQYVLTFEHFNDAVLDLTKTLRKRLYSSSCLMYGYTVQSDSLTGEWAMSGSLIKNKYGMCNIQLSLIYSDGLLKKSSPAE